jgi:uncharacterized protein
LEEPDKQPPRPSIFGGPGMRLWLVVALNFACSGVFVMLARTRNFAWMTAGPGDDYPVDYARFALAIYGVLCFAVPAIVFANVFPMERFGWFKLNRKVPFLPVAIGVLAILFAIFGIDYLYEWFISRITDPNLKEFQALNNQANEWMMTMPAPRDLFVLLFTSALVPAICEELFFRATIQQLFAEWTRKPHAAVLLTAVLFSLLHNNPAAIVSIFLTGLILGYAFYWTGSLRTTVIMHFIYNASTIIFTYYAERSPALAAWEPSAAIAFSGLAISAGLMFFLWKVRPKREEV